MKQMPPMVQAKTPKINRVKSPRVTRGAAPESSGAPEHSGPTAMQGEPLPAETVVVHARSVRQAGQLDFGDIGVYIVRRFLALVVDLALKRWHNDADIRPAVAIRAIVVLACLPLVPLPVVAHQPAAPGPDRVRVGTGTRYASPGPP